MDVFSCKLNRLWVLPFTHHKTKNDLILKLKMGVLENYLDHGGEVRVRALMLELFLETMGLTRLDAEVRIGAERDGSQRN